MKLRAALTPGSRFCNVLGTVVCYGCAAYTLRIPGAAVTTALLVFSGTVWLLSTIRDWDPKPTKTPQE